MIAMKKIIILLSGLVCLAAITSIRATDIVYEGDELARMKVFMEKMNQCYANPLTSLPHHAWVCDIIGVGRVTNAYDVVTYGRGNGFVDITIDNFWRGEQGTNSFRIQMWSGGQPPVSDDPLVFFLTKNNKFLVSSPFKFEGEPQIDMDYLREQYKPNGLWFLRGSLSILKIDENNADLINYASNLVFAVNTCNTNMFYEIMRDGCPDEPFPPTESQLKSRIYWDSYAGLMYPPLYFTKDFIVKTIWKDPLLPEKNYIRSYVGGKSNHMYGLELGAEKASVIMVR